MIFRSLWKFLICIQTRKYFLTRDIRIKAPSGDASSCPNVGDKFQFAKISLENTVKANEKNQWELFFLH